MPLDDFATEIEPEPCSANTMSTRIIRPLEAAEDACLLICRNADACISNAQECRLRLSVFLQGDLNCSTCWTVLDGVAEEVGEHLFHAPWIDIHDEVFRGGEQARIFGRFERADNARAHGIGGTGLGLYLCREI